MILTPADLAAPVGVLRSTAGEGRKITGTLSAQTDGGPTVGTGSVMVDSVS